MSEETNNRTARKPLQLGIIGCGNVLTAYGPEIQKLRARGLAEPVLACGRESQREAAAAQLGAVPFTTEANAVLRSGEVDAVLIGTTGTIQMLGDDWDPDGYELWQNAAGCWQVFKETHPDWPWSDGLRHFVECIRDNTRPLVTPEHALHVIEIMLKAQQAGREGRTLEIESTFEPPAFAVTQATEPAHLMHDRSRKHE